MNYSKNYFALISLSLVVIALISCCQGAKFTPRHSMPTRQEFQDWQKVYGKSYTSEKEEQKRYGIWKANFEKIHKVNSDFENGLVTYKLAVNQFADLTHQEFEKRYLIKINATNINQLRQEFPNRDLPKELDWIKKGAVLPVEDQGYCGSCYSFSALGAVEGQMALSSKYKMVSLSKQQIVDCSHSYGNQGCDGGLQPYVYHYLNNHSIEKGTDYPYKDGVSNCKYDANRGILKVADQKIVKNSETALQGALVEIGPIAIAVDARGSFPFYHSGVYYSKTCSQMQLTHAILAIGYGATDKGIEYWHVKNSWSTDWGMEGFGYMSRNKDNNCGIANFASYPILSPAAHHGRSNAMVLLSIICSISTLMNRY